MAYADIYTAATDPAATLRQKVAVALHKAAVDVINEATNTANHANRKAWAIKVTESNGSPTAMAERWIWKVLENPTIAANPAGASDNDVQFVVNSIVNTMANRG